MIKKKNREDLEWRLRHQAPTQDLKPKPIKLSNFEGRVWARISMTHYSLLITPRPSPFRKRLNFLAPKFMQFVQLKKKIAIIIWYDNVNVVVVLQTSGRISNRKWLKLIYAMSGPIF